MRDAPVVEVADGVTVAYDPAVMLLLPEPDEVADLELWCSEAADVWCRSEGVPVPADVRRSLAETLYDVATADVGQPFQFRFAHVLDLRRGVLPVMLGVGDAEGDVTDTLRELTGADDPLAIEPPVVEQVAVRGGSALRTLKYLAPDGGGVVAAVNYAWFATAGGAYVWIRAASVDPGSVLAALDDLDAFAGSVAVAPVGTA